MLSNTLVLNISLNKTIQSKYREGFLPSGSGLDSIRIETRCAELDLSPTGSVNLVHVLESGSSTSHVTASHLETRSDTI